MRLLKFIRSYYLYFYFHVTEIKRGRDESAFPFNGFVATLFLVVSFQVMAIIFTLNATTYWFINDVLLEKLFSFRGDINLLFIVIMVISILVTYLICCWGVRYEEINDRLAQTPWLSKRSVFKLLLLPAVSMVLCILSGPLFY